MPSPGATSKPSRDSAPAHCACVSGMPITFAARATRSVTGSRSGMAGCWSVTGPKAVSGVPQISATRPLMRSICASAIAGSTPRSKRWPASVAKP